MEVLGSEPNAGDLVGEQTDRREVVPCGERMGWNDLLARGHPASSKSPLGPPEGDQATCTVISDACPEFRVNLLLFLAPYFGKSCISKGQPLEDQAIMAIPRAQNQLSLPGSRLGLDLGPGDAALWT